MSYVYTHDYDCIELVHRVGDFEIAIVPQARSRRGGDGFHWKIRALGIGSPMPLRDAETALELAKKELRRSLRRALEELEP